MSEKFWMLETANGCITRNDSIISLKTRIYSNRLSFFEKLRQELTEFLNEKQIKFDDASWEAHEALGSFRKGTITVFVCSDDTEGMKQLPYDGNAID